MYLVDLFENPEKKSSIDYSSIADDGLTVTN